ncbi:MAG: hypothetical protein COW88_01705 [Candidatus Lloydbacteria bacterium CG22_combo_CG10-13_8_21_14_all_47_15]|uniref:Ribosome-binding factor A n=1 Tax=Candidatus Lloydbacteria bacterium CG22_combo_CG10-13_8_21_14_all_47_15 TaxID=1974635 RepID=A0A2H0CUF4_9BACT|nr:MAG: hypothetical protein COW88_01705 [Candidatus Lloydbacteria bacterium CG22_combo_CG10-13_8_21_14_all_47_15]
MSKRQEQVKELLNRLAAAFFSDIAGTHSLITVTGVTIAKDFARATVFISVLPEQAEHEALSFAKRKRSDLREYIRQNTDLRRLPRIEIEIDQGEQHRRRIDELLREDKN